MAETLVKEDEDSLNSYNEDDFTCKIHTKALVYLLWHLYAFSILDLFATFLSAVKFLWMIIEFINIGTNEKLDGNSCFLDDDTLSHIRDLSENAIQLGTGTIEFKLLSNHFVQV